MVRVEVRSWVSMKGLTKIHMCVFDSDQIDSVFSVP